MENLFLFGVLITEELHRVLLEYPSRVITKDIHCLLITKVKQICKIDSDGASSSSSLSLITILYPPLLFLLCSLTSLLSIP